MAEGTEPTEVAGVAPEAAPEVGPAGHDKGNYDARILNEPDFALKEIKAKDRRITELGQASRRYDKLEPHYQNVGGQDGFLAMAHYASAVQQNPEMKRIADEFIQTGRVPASSQTPGGSTPEAEPEYVDPDVQKLRDELRESKTAVTQLTQRMAGAESRGFRGSIERNITKHMERWPASMPELREEAKAMILARVEAAELQAAQGDISSKNTLEQLGGPQGAKTLDYITYDLYMDNHKAIVRAEEQTEATSVTAHETTGRSTVSTTGGSEPAIPDGLTTTQMVQRALEQETRKAGYDPAKLL